MLLSCDMISNTIESLKPNNVAEKSDSESRSSRDFFKIASLGTALGFGAAAASTASLRSSPTGFSFQITAGTFVAFAIGAAIALIYWKLVASNSKAARRGSFLLALAGVGLFLYPLRLFPRKFARPGRGTHPGHWRPVNCRLFALAGETLPGWTAASWMPGPKYLHHPSAVRDN